MYADEMATLRDRNVGQTDSSPSSMATEGLMDDVHLSLTPSHGQSTREDSRRLLDQQNESGFKYNTRPAATHDAPEGSQPANLRPERAGIECSSLKSDAYSKLIVRCLRTAPGFRRTLEEIYIWFQKNTTKQQECIAKGHSPDGWKNSIRHNLSMNEDFVKIAVFCPEGKPGDRNKKHIWSLSPRAQTKGFVLSTTRFRPKVTTPRVQKRTSRNKGSRAAGVSGSEERSVRPSSPAHENSTDSDMTLCHPPSGDILHFGLPDLVQPLPGRGIGSRSNDGIRTPASTISTLADSASSELPAMHHFYSPDIKLEQFDVDAGWVHGECYDRPADCIPYRIEMPYYGYGHHLRSATRAPEYTIEGISPVEHMMRIASRMEPPTCSMADLRLAQAQDEQLMYTPSCEAVGPFVEYPAQQRS